MIRPIPSTISSSLVAYEKRRYPDGPKASPGTAATSTSSGFSGGSASSGFSVNNSGQTSMLLLETGWLAREDYDRMGVIIANVKSRYGNSLIGVDATTKAFINRYLNTPYKNMFRGGYQIRFTNAPISNCANPAPSLNALKSFTY